MKKILISFTLVLTIILSFTPIMVSAEIVNSGTCGDDAVWMLDDEGTLTITGNGKMTIWTGYLSSLRNNVKSVIIDNGITNICDDAFRYCKNLISVKIPYSVTSIGEDAFYECRELTEITIPNSVLSIGSYAFSRCDSLDEILLPNSISTIGVGAFESCDKLMNINIENNKNNDGTYFSVDGVLYNEAADLIAYPSGRTGECSIPEGVSCISDSAFSGCKIEKIILPDGLNVIGNAAFYNCFYLEDPEIPDSVEFIGNYAWANCDTIQTIILPNSISYISDSTFRYCDNLSYVFIPDTIQSIGEGAFCECPKLTQITIPDGVTEISNYTFSGCTSLKNITLPKTIATIGLSAFGNCDNLEQVNFMGSKSEWEKIDIETFNNGNDSLNNAQITYGEVLLTIINDNTKLFEGYVKRESTINTSILPSKQDMHIIFYTDENLQNEYNIMEPIMYDTTLYAYYELDSINTIYISGDATCEIGNKNFVQQIYYASKHEIKYLTCSIQYPSHFNLTKITPVDFKYVTKESESCEGSFTTVVITCQYADDISASNNTLLNPFDLTFEIPSNITQGNYNINLTEITEGFLSDGTTVSFKNLLEHNITVIPKLVEQIEIYGNDTIHEASKYTVVVTPESAANKEVLWSVSDTNIAYISQDGILFPKHNGIVTVFASAIDGSGVVGEKNIMVYAPAEIDYIESDVGEWNIEFESSTHNYAIYVSPDTSSITLTTTYSGGTLLYNDTVLINNKSKEFLLNSDITAIQLERKNVDGFEDSIYTITIIKEIPIITLNSLTQKNSNEYSFDITIDNKTLSYDDATIVVALYDENNCLCGIQQQDITYDANNISVDVSHIGSAYKYKIMFWDKVETMNPLCRAHRGVLS